MDLDGPVAKVRPCSWVAVWKCSGHLNAHPVRGAWYAPQFPVALLCQEGFLSPCCRQSPPRISQVAITGPAASVMTVRVAVTQKLRERIPAIGAVQLVT